MIQMAFIKNADIITARVLQRAVEPVACSHQSCRLSNLRELFINRWCQNEGRHCTFSQLSVLVSMGYDPVNIFCAVMVLIVVQFIECILENKKARSDTNC